MNDFAERGLGLPDSSRRSSALAKLSAMMVVAVTEPADNEPNPPTRRKMTPSHITAWRNRLVVDTVGQYYRRRSCVGNLESVPDAKQSGDP